MLFAFLTSFVVFCRNCFVNVVMVFLLFVYVCCCFNDFGIVVTTVQTGQELTDTQRQLSIDACLTTEAIK